MGVGDVGDVGALHARRQLQSAAGRLPDPVARHPADAHKRLLSAVEVEARAHKPAGARQSSRCLGFTVANGKSMEVLKDPQAPTGKRLVPTLDSTATCDLYIRRKSSKEAQMPRRRTTVGAVPGRELLLPQLPGPSEREPARKAEVFSATEAEAPSLDVPPIERCGTAPTIRINLSSILAKAQLHENGREKPSKRSDRLRPRSRASATNFFPKMEAL